MALTAGGVQITIVGIVTTCLSLIFLGLRLWSRHILRTPLAHNDYMTIVVFFLTAALVSLCIAASFAGGFGYQLEEIAMTDPHSFKHFLQLFVTAEILWAVANTGVKFSILSLYTTLFPNPKFIHVCYATMAFTVVFMLGSLMGTFFCCEPIQYAWDKSIPGGKCVGQRIAGFVSGVTNLAIDVFVVLLPMPMLYRLHMSLGSKLAIAVMFGVGAIIWVVSLLRVLWIFKDNTIYGQYATPLGVIYSILEPTLGIMNACVPTIRPATHKLCSFRPTQRIRKVSITARSGVTTDQERNAYLSPHDDVSINYSFSENITPLNSPLGENGLVGSSGNGGAITITRQWEVTAGS
ncbi:hypothetical protein F5Y11DRAFT_363423 [Daldinia sp. FL1419]|nr:hypothetical protein F5Y11DRAFT_363423 [Daldinia sp. FL1419]